MAEPLSANTQEQMGALCRKISVAHDLDPEIQKELYGHMEDKLLAYLSGEEPVTEEDAFILVREHFGDLAVLKGLLQDVHAHEVHVSVARRLAGAFVVSISLLIVVNALHALIRTWAAASAPSRVSSAVYFPQFQVTKLFLAPGAVVLVWIVLHRWQRQLDAGKRAWFVRWRPISLGALIALLLVISALGPTVLAAPELFDAQTVSWLKALQWPLIGLALCTTVAQCSVWLWWCDRTPRRAVTIAYGFVAWYILRIITSFRMLTFPRLILYIVDSAAGLAPDARFLAEGDIAGSSLSWHLVAQQPHLSVAVTHFHSYVFLPTLRALVLGAVALTVYVLVQRVRRRRAKLFQNT